MSALRLAAVFNAQPDLLLKGERKVVHRLGRARLELELQLADRLGRLIRPHLAPIEGELYLAAFGLEDADRASDVGDEDRCELRHDLGVGEQSGDRRRLQRGQVELALGRRCLVLRSMVHSPFDAAFLLQGLDPAPPLPPHAQCDTVARKQPVGGVVIDTVEALGMGPLHGRRGEDGVSTQQSRLIGRKGELEFDFCGHGNSSEPQYSPPAAGRSGGSIAVRYRCGSTAVRQPRPPLACPVHCRPPPARGCRAAPSGRSGRRRTGTGAGPFDGSGRRNPSPTPARCRRGRP